jgi:putative DNA primase/helicase
MIGRVTDGYLKGRLFLPYFQNGAVVYYATRAMPDSSFQDNKYMKASLSESPAYRHIPWGLQTLNRVTTHDTLIISEGYFDAVSWEREGYPVISPITGNFSKDQWSDVISACKLFKRVFIIFDNDAISHAGDGFTARTSQRLFQNRIPFVVGHTPNGIKDVNDYYAAGGNLQQLIDSAQDGLKYIVSQYTDPLELKRFIMSINRFTDSTAIAEALDSVASRFPAAVIKSIQKSADSAPTESQIVDEIIEKHNIIHVDRVGFYEWDGRVWNKISDNIVRNYADILYGKRFATAQRVNAACNLLKSRAICDVHFDRNPVLTFQNGTLEIETGNFRAFSESDYCSIIMDYDYDPHATAPVWESFIQDITDDEPRRAEILQFIAGYILLPDCRHQKIFLLIGSGGNGKSVYLELIQKLFGDRNVTHVEPNGLTKEFERIRLKDSLLNIGSDINSDLSKGEIREWLLKIADGTSIQACYKGLDHIDFIPRCKLVYACNAMPTAEIVNGLNRRMQFVDFPCQYVENPDPDDPKQKPRDIYLTQRLSAELPGIFNWAYAGYKLLRTVGYFTDAPEQTEFIRQFETTSNPVLVFCEDHDFVGTVSRDEIYSEYRYWCESTGHKSLSREKFIPKFRDALGDRIIDERRTTINGVRTRAFVIEPVQ